MRGFVSTNFFCCDETTKEIVDVMYFLCFLKRKNLIPDQFVDSDKHWTLSNKTLLQKIRPHPGADLPLHVHLKVNLVI